jgi:ubiquinone/menaquinone biosynthesis C-methylase UbiE
MGGWIVGVIIVIAILVILDREIYFYEATHLGPRVQSWLYDRWAAKYDSDKRESQAHDAEVLARPMVQLLIDHPDALVLDVATGTGRLPVALLSEPEFQGRIIALDISREMLVRAAEKLIPFEDRVTLIRQPSFPLPFPDASFDVVCCMEALEVMPNMEQPLRELARVLRPGGIFLTTRGTEASGRKAKVKSAETFTALLETFGFEQIEIIPWWKLFDRVWARKAGTSAPLGSRAVTEVLLCPSCGRATLTSVSLGGLRCNQCHKEYPVADEKILLL